MTGHLILDLADALIGDGGSQTSLGSGTFSPALNRWYHVAVSRSGSLFSFYLDGVLNSAVVATVTIGRPRATSTRAYLLYQAIGRRRSHRHRFIHNRVPTAVHRALGVRIA